MRALTAVLVAVTLFASACGGSAGSSTALDSTEGEPAADTPSMEDIERQSPIADFLGEDFGNFQFDEAAELERQRDAERQTAECMAAEGFEYIPRDVADMVGFSGPPEDEFEVWSAEWVNKYGFGISTQHFAQSMVGDLVGGPEDRFMPPDPGEFVDPNQEYVEGLSAGERDAYQQALHGEVPDFCEGPPDDDWRPSGCQFVAFEDQQDSNAGRFYQAFNDELQTMFERIEADSRIVAFEAEVSACVAEEGLTWTGIRDVFEQFFPRLMQLQGGGSSISGDAITFEAVGFEPLSPEQLAELAEIQADEIALAKAVLECGGGPVQTELIRNEVRVEYEQRFLDENADVIEEFRPAE